MKLFESIRQRIQRLSEQHRAAKQKKRERFLENLSCDDINVIEFNGRIYVSFEGAPVVRVDDLKVEVTTLLAQARADYLAWIEQFEG